MKQILVGLLLISVILVAGCTQSFTEDSFNLFSVKWDEDFMWEKQCEEARRLPAMYGNPTLAEAEWHITYVNGVLCRWSFEEGWFSPDKTEELQVKRFSANVFDNTDITLCCRKGNEELLCKTKILEAKCDEDGNVIS